MIFLSGFESVIELLVEPDGTLGYKGDPIRPGPEHSPPDLCVPPGIITSELSSGLECEDAGQGHQVGGSAVSVTRGGGAPPL